MRMLRMRTQVATLLAAAALLLIASTAFADSPRRMPLWPRTEFGFDPASERVTVSFPVEDAEGNYVPDARPNNFVVYEDGVRQRDLHVDIQRAPVTLGILLEHGGRYQTLNEAIWDAVSSSTQMLMDHVSREDELAVWEYGDRLEPIGGLLQGRDALAQALQKVQTPSLSESNLYDALTQTLAELRKLSGRKALLLISSGVDTFSDARLPDVLQRARDANIPVYIVNICKLLQRDVSVNPTANPYGHLNWKRASAALEGIAKATGGRMYVPESTLELPATYDDLMESLRARYVISYQSTTAHRASEPRQVRVDIVDPRTGAPLMLADANGRPVHSSVMVAGTYVPDRAKATATG